MLFTKSEAGLILNTCFKREHFGESIGGSGTHCL